MEKPKDKKYTYIEKSYEDDDDESNDNDSKDNSGPKVKSELDLPTQRLMELIFKYISQLSFPRRVTNVVSSENHFNAVLEEIGYNKDKLPLGKLGKSTLKTGFEQLRELASLVKHPSLAKNKYNKDRKEVSWSITTATISDGYRSLKNGRTNITQPSPMSSVAIVPL